MSGWIVSRLIMLLGNTRFHPVHIDYRNMEMVLNVKSLGNLNRQFVSLLRSEQESSSPIIGNFEAWEKVLGRFHHMDLSFLTNCLMDLQVMMQSL